MSEFPYIKETTKNTISSGTVTGTTRVFENCLKLIITYVTNNSAVTLVVNENDPVRIATGGSGAQQVPVVLDFGGQPENVFKVSITVISGRECDYILQQAL